jgi:hypothetical protein
MNRCLTVCLLDRNSDVTVSSFSASILRQQDTVKEAESGQNERGIY